MAVPTASDGDPILYNEEGQGLDIRQSVARLTLPHAPAIVATERLASCSLCVNVKEEKTCMSTRSRVLRRVNLGHGNIGIRLSGCFLALIISVATGFGALATRAATRVTLDPPPFQITSPLYNGVAEGPVGTNVSVQAAAGSGWDVGATITLSVTLEDHATCDATTAIPVSTASITVANDGSFGATFVWPSAASQTSTSATYVVCANESGAGTLAGRSTNVFNVLGNAAPTLDVSPTTAHAGDPVQITGANWFPIQPITLRLQGVGQTFQQDPGEQLGNTVTPDQNGNFTISVTLPTNRVGSSTTGNAQDVVATMGTANSTNVYPLMATSQQLSILPQVTPTPSPTLAPTFTPVHQSSGGGGSTNTNQEKLLIALLGLIAVVLLLAGIIVAVLALRGRNPQNGPPGTPGAPPNGGYGGYGPGDSDATVADGNWPERGWNDDDRWQPPGGRPWSGTRASSPYDGRNLPPPIQQPALDDDDDRFRTRMGDPYQPPPSRPAGPPSSRPAGPPPSRPNGPPPPMQSRPNTSRPVTPGWDDDPSGQDTGPVWTPPRR